MALAGKGQSAAPVHRFGAETEAALEKIQGLLGSDIPGCGIPGRDIPECQKRFYAIKLFERDEKITAQMDAAPDVEALIKQAEEALDDDAESIITNERYTYITSIIDGCYKRRHRQKLSVSDRIDHIVTNRWLALPIFAAVM